MIKLYPTLTCPMPYFLGSVGGSYLCIVFVFLYILIYVGGSEFGKLGKFFFKTCGVNDLQVFATYL